MTPASTGRSVISWQASRMASTYFPVRPAPTGGTCSASASSGVVTRASFTVGTSPGMKWALAPKASASTDRSIMLTLAQAGTRSATSFIPFA